MRKTMKLSIAALALATGLAACHDGRTADASQDEFKRDLQLASSMNLDLAGGRVDSSLLNSLETKPQGAQAPAPTVKKGAGTRAIRSEAPTVLATSESDVAADDEAGSVETMSESASETSNEPVAVAPRPAPIPMQTGGAGDYGTGSSNGGVFGGGIGVVIRGGGVDGDHCEIHNGRGGRTTTRGGPVYVPNFPGIPRSGGSGISIGARRPGTVASGASSSQRPASTTRGVFTRGRTR